MAKAQPFLQFSLAGGTERGILSSKGFGQAFCNGFASHQKAF